MGLLAIIEFLSVSEALQIETRSFEYESRQAILRERPELVLSKQGMWCKGHGREIKNCGYQSYSLCKLGTWEDVGSYCVRTTDL